MPPSVCFIMVGCRVGGQELGILCPYFLFVGLPEKFHKIPLAFVWGGAFVFG